MATKKKTTTKTTVEEPEKELDAFDRARLDFLGESGVKLTIYRYDDGEAAYLKRVQWTETIDEEWIRKKWGPGTYQLRFVDETGERRYSQVVQIAADVPPAPPAASSSSEPALFIQTLQKQNEIMLTGLLARSAAPASGGGGNEALVALVQGMQAQNLELLKSVMNRPDTSSTLLQVLERGMAIASEAHVDSEGGWLSQVARIAKEVLPSVAEMARARATMVPPGAVPVAGAGASHGGRGGNPPTSSPALPPGGAPPSSSPTNGAPAPSGFDLDELVRGYAESIIEAAKSGSKPDDVADAILGFIPPALYDELEPLTVERAIRVAPALSQHRGYVEQLVGSIREALREDDDRGPEAA